MAQIINIDLDNLHKLRDIDPRLVSYNVEMTEVTGGTFWKEYTPEQIAGTKAYEASDDPMQMYAPIDLTNPKLRKLAKEIGPSWVRVSGTWANSTYYDFEGTTNGIAPEGFQSVLTEEQWKNLLDFVKALDAKLLISVANCEGIHKADEPWNPAQAEIIFEYSKNYGVPIDAAEFTNEPNLLAMSRLPEGYTEEHYRRDQDIFFRWIKENYPEVLCVGPCTVGDEVIGMGPDNIGMGSTGLPVLTTEQLMESTKEPMDVFSYHYYNGVSERIPTLACMHWPEETATSEAYLKAAPDVCDFYCKLRDKYAPDTPIWVTEAGDAGGGGNTWACTYLDVLRTANELGMFPTKTDGIIFHNTLASSAYGFLKHKTFDPRPNYWLIVLWTKLMGTEVFDTGISICEGAHVYAHSRKDGKDGYVFMAINNSTTDTTTIKLPQKAEMYQLSADSLRSSEIKLNGTVLKLKDNDELPELNPVLCEEKSVDLAPCTVTFFVFGEK